MEDSLGFFDFTYLYALYLIPSNLSSVTINIYRKIYGKRLKIVGTLSGLGDLIMLVNIIPGHMIPASFVNEVIMIATMGAFSSIGMPSH